VNNHPEAKGLETYRFKWAIGCPIHGPFLRGVPVLQNEILVEVLLVHLVDLGGVHEVNNLTDTIDR
jgi:hypothetical protein